MAKRKVFTVSFIAIVAAALFAGGYWVFASLFAVDKSIPPEKLAAVELGSIARSVVAVGKVEPFSKVEIKSKASGIIHYVYVDAGDRVRQGQLLLELDKEALEAQLREARAILKAAEGKLEETESQAKTVEAALHKARLEAENRDYDFALAEYRRYRLLFDQGLVPGAELEAAEQKLRSAELNRKALQAAVAVKEAELEQNRRTAATIRSEIDQAQAQLERAEENLRYASIRSPIDGIVLSRELEVGDAVSSILQLGSNATLIMTLGDTRELYVKGKVDETDIGLVRAGMPVRVTVDAYKNRVFRGKVMRIAPMGVEKDNVTRFEVRVSILDNSELLKVNMSANAEIILEEHQGALVVPESALIYNEKRETFVEVPDPASATGRRLVPVKTGLSNGARTEVLAGLKEGDRVVLQ